MSRGRSKAGAPAMRHDTQLFGQHQRHGGFAQARGAVSSTVEGVVAQAGGLHRNPEHLLELALADVITQSPGSQAFITAAITLGSCGLWSHQTPAPGACYRR